MQILYALAASLIFATPPGWTEIRGPLPSTVAGPVIVRSSEGAHGRKPIEAVSSVPMIVDGPCYSGCAIAFLINGNACFTKRARFALHMPYSDITGQRFPYAAQFWVEKFQPNVPLNIRLAMFRRELTYFSAAQMTAAVPHKTCK